MARITLVEIALDGSYKLFLCSSPPGVRAIWEKAMWNTLLTWYILLLIITASNFNNFFYYFIIFYFFLLYKKGNGLGWVGGERGVYSHFSLKE